MIIPPCLKIVAAARELGRIARSGEGGVIKAIPNPCYLNEYAQIEFRKLEEFEVREHGERVAYILGEDVYVFPAEIHKRVFKTYVKLVEGRSAKRGLLLVGPPGTGKTVLTARIPRALGLEVVEIRPDIQSKWVGETEKKIAKAFEAAESAAPAVVALNDADWALASREMVDRHWQYHLSLVDTFLRELEKERDGVMAVANTNASERILDAAALRGGRLSAPIYVPLPSYKDFELYCAYSRAHEEACRKLVKYAKAAANMGYSFADWVEMLAEYEETGEFSLAKPRYGAGYRRLAISGEFSSKIFANLPKSSGGRFGVSVKTDERLTKYEEKLLNFLAAVALANELGRPILALDDHSKLRDALYAAENMRATLIVTDDRAIEELSILPWHSGNYYVVATAPVWHVVNIKLASETAIDALVDLFAIACELSGGKCAREELRKFVEKRGRLDPLKYLKLFANVSIEDISTI